MPDLTILYSSITLVSPKSKYVLVRASLTPLGHGGQTPDLDGDEEDGYDEVIYPVDFRTAGHIVDDEMHRIMYDKYHSFQNTTLTSTQGRIT
jgi:hypothetical protein